MITTIKKIFKGDITIESKNKKNKRVLVLGYGHPYFDKRVYKKCVLSLSKIFDEVYYVVHEKRDEKISVPENIKDVYIPNFPIKTVKRMIQYDPVFWKKLNSLEQKFDLIYVHDLPGYRFPAKRLKTLKVKNNAKIIIDLHEYIPDVVFPSIKPTPLTIAINKFAFEKPIVETADGIIAVSKFVQKKILEYNINKETTMVLPNYAHQKLNSIVKRENAIAFVGKMNPGNGAGNIEKFIEYYLPKNYVFYFIGSDTKGLLSLAFSEKCLNQVNIKALGMLGYDDMLKKISEIKFTLSHMNPNKINVINSLPNKFYDSFAAGTPVLSINKLKEQNKIIEKNGLGIIFNLDFSEKGIKEFQKQILDEEKYEKTLENIKTHQDEFLWQTHENEYIEFIKSILKKED